MNEELKQLYKSGAKLDVIFIKRDGSERHMICQRDKILESLVQGKIIKHNDSVLKVVEITEDNVHQWRTIPLDRVKSFKTL